MMSDSESPPPFVALPDAGAESGAARSSDSLRRLIELAARAVDMADASLSLRAGPTASAITTPGYDAARGHLVARLDAAVVASGQPLAIPDLADRSGQRPWSPVPMSGAYLGVPLLSPGNTVTGVLHVLDRDPRPTLDRQAGLLAAFGRAVSDHLELRDLSRPPGVDDQQAADIAQAIRAGRIVPWYQPVADLSTGKIIGLEALARRILPDGRIEGPALFVPIAERSDLIVDLDVAVARVALKELKEWQRTNPALTMSINLSGRHLNQDDWVARLVDLGSDAGVSPTTVQIEVTETARPLDSASGGVRMQLARSLGFSLWLDDFGSGWAGIRDLLRLPVDGIKIDRSFAVALGTRVDNVLIRALTTAAIDLGLKVTLEGIERREQVELALELGCHNGQGFFWSPPVPAVGVDRLLASTPG